MISPQLLEKPRLLESLGPWSAEADRILSLLEAASNPAIERRAAVRMPHRVRALLRLIRDLPEAPPWVLFTRDVSTRGLGFVTQQRLPPGYGGQVELAVPNGQIVTIDCTLRRCRQCAIGWYEGALYFNREQWMFAPQ